MTCQTIHAGSIDDLARRLDRLRAQAERRPDDCRAALAHAEARADYEAARAADFKLRNALLQRQMRRLIDELRRKARQVEAFGALSRQSSRFKSGTPDASTASHVKRRGRRGVAALADLFTVSGEMPGEEGRAA